MRRHGGHSSRAAQLEVTVRYIRSARKHQLRLPIAGLASLILILGPGTAPASGKVAAVAPDHLTNLAHLDSLTAMVSPPRQDGHTTYRLDREPDLGVLWVYADHQPDG